MKHEKTQIYLGKAGKTFGPFTAKEFDEMFADGRVNDYTWIWNAESQSWKPLETMPPALPPSKPEFGSEKKPLRENASISWESVEAICHGGLTILSGRLESVTETGCSLVSSHVGAGPKFGSGACILLNLVNKEKRINFETSVRVVGIERHSAAWVYRLRWDRMPSLHL